MYNFVEVSGHHLGRLEVSTFVFLFLQNAIHKQIKFFFIDCLFEKISESVGVIHFSVRFSSFR